MAYGFVLDSCSILFLMIMIIGVINCT